MRSSVFPEPAGACTRNDRVTSSARRRAAASSPVRASRVAASFIDVAFLGAERRRADAAQRLAPALPARRGDVARRDARNTLADLHAELLELGAPVGLEFRP